MHHPEDGSEIAHSASERGDVLLRRRVDGALELRANGVFVMDDVEVGTEQALATEALGLVDVPADVLVGGLGLGFTMHAVLADARVRRCVVVEIEEALVGWMRDGTVPHGPEMLADGRVRVVVADVGAALAESPPASYDLLLLDVDNGPGHLVHAGNAVLYEPPFLTAAHRLLRPGGALVIWSAAEAPALEEAMATVFAAVEPRAFAVDLQGRSEHYWLYVATVASPR